MTYTSSRSIQRPHRANAASEIRHPDSESANLWNKLHIAAVWAVLFLAGCSVPMNQGEVQRGRVAVAISVSVAQHGGADPTPDHTCNICAGTGRSGDGLGPCPCGKECICE